MTDFPNKSLLTQKDPDVAGALLDDAARRGKQYRELIEERRVGPLPQAVEKLTAFDEPFPSGPEEPMKVLQMLDEHGSAATMGIAGPRFFGFVIGGSLPVTVAANWMVTAWDQNCGLYAITPATAKLEEVALRWLLDLFGLPATTAGSFVTGAAMANFSCLAAARHNVLKRIGWDVESDGLIGAPEVTVVVSEESHPTVTKALGLLGLGRNRVLAAPVDEQGRMQADRLPEIKSPAIVCLQVGNINTGSCDPVSRIVPWAHERGAWAHVDGAFGMWAAVSGKLSHLVDGLVEADSWATDAHKWLNVPYDCGIALVRDQSALRDAMTFTASYLPVSEHRDPSHYTPELSRRARGVEVWAALKTLGRSGLAEMIERGVAMAQRFAEGLRSAGFEILNEVVLNQVLVSFGREELTNRIIRRIQEDGTCWCGGTVWRGMTAMRISISSWSTTEEDVDRSLEAMIRIAGEEQNRIKR